MIKEELLERILKEELKLLREFLYSLKEERNAIISFSLEGLVRERNKKEMIIKKLSILEEERKRLMEEKRYLKSPLKEEIKKLAKEIMEGMEKNKRLLSFSMGHVESSIERILDLIREEGYGKRGENAPFMFSKEV